MRPIVWMSSVLVALSACGGVGSDCPPGQTAFADGCVLIDPDDVTAPVTTATPAIGPVRRLPDAVTLFTSEPATIFYTIDGSEPTLDSPAAAGTVTISPLTDGQELAYFAVDFLGNTEAVRRGTFTIDQVGPSAPSPVTAVEQGDHSIDVTWAAADVDDLARYVVVRSYAGAVPVAPEAGRRYVAGDAVAPDQIVLLDGTGNTLTDPDALPGFNLYSVWPIDAAGNVGERASAWGQNTDAPTLAMRLRVSVATDPATVEVINAPAQLEVTGQATYQPLNDTVNLRLSLGNPTARTLHNLKLVVTELGAGALANGHGAIQGLPYFHVGPAAVAARSVRTADLSLVGITGTPDTFEMAVRFETHPLLVIGEDGQLRLTDSFPSGRAVIVPVERGSGAGAGNQFTEGVFNRDGSKILVSDGRRPGLLVVDPATVTTSTGPRYAERGFVDSLALSADGQKLYVVLNTEIHRRMVGAGAGVVDFGSVVTEVLLLRVDAHTLREEERLVIASGTGDPGTRPRGHRFTVSVDGTRGAMAVKHDEAVYVVDLEAFTVLHRVQVGSPGPTERIRYAAIRPDGAKVYVAYRNVPNRLDVIDAATGAVDPAPIVITATALSGNPGDLTFGGNGKLYLSRKNVGPAEASLIILNPGTGTQVARFVGASIRGVDFSPDGSIAYAADTISATARAFSTATDLEVDTDGVGANGITPVPSGTPRAHVVLISPQ